ncbi:hypothetical protein K2173_016932 [Erythroxylum novogranatense]|uniref:Uncharacterized protein n=1 Tax=Erythroxylum novogranatense TaxID=1862640 RepID=A0AAV8U5B7_9ROSI|nr:hypothetical protein K2173_016932 [Erythroxylum novogranatense]
MAIYVNEEDVYRCPKHPSRRRRTGICHHCLRDRLSSLCPICADERPCNCYSAAAAASSSSSGSSSSSFSRFSTTTADGIGSMGRVSSLIENEPAFRRSRSVAVSSLRSNLEDSSEYSFRKDSLHRSKKTGSFSSFWSVFKSKRVDGVARESHSATRKKSVDDERTRLMMMRKSRSLAVPSDSGVADVRSTKSSKGWHFPSPIKVFRQSISRGLLHERSPLYRG